MAKKAKTDAKPKKKSKLKGLFTFKRMLIVGLALIILIGAGAGAWFFFFRDSNGDSEAISREESSREQDAGESEETVPAFEEIIDLEPFDRIALKPSGALNLITMSIALELSNPGLRDQVEKDMMSIRQAIEMEARTVTWLSLRNPDGKLKFKYRLIKRINEVVPRAPIRNIYFTQLIMQ